MTFPGAGIAAMASSEENTADYRSHLGVQSIGPDKINQLRHLRLIPDIGVLREHMKKHMAVVKPRFDMVNEVLDHELGDAGVARWTRPDGGYFISLDTAPGLAKRVIKLAAQAGVALTSAGAPFPYGNDPDDCNIRIAPTFASLNDVRSATEALSACIILATAEQQ
jgi:DNA-binding transcriptional MocR family regulator